MLFPDHPNPFNKELSLLLIPTHAPTFNPLIRFGYPKAIGQYRSSTIPAPSSTPYSNNARRWPKPPCHANCAVVLSMLSIHKTHKKKQDQIAPTRSEPLGKVVVVLAAEVPQQLLLGDVAEDVARAGGEDEAVLQ